MSFQSPTHKSSDAPQLQSPEDFLTPEQRLDAIAEILATIGLRAMKETADAASHEIDPS